LRLRESAVISYNKIINYYFSKQQSSFATHPKESLVATAQHWDGKKVGYIIIL